MNTDGAKSREFVFDLIMVPSLMTGKWFRDFIETDLQLLISEEVTAGVQGTVARFFDMSAGQNLISIMLFYLN